MNTDRLKKLAGITGNKTKESTKVTVTIPKVKLYEEVEFKSLLKEFNVSGTIDGNSNIASVSAELETKRDSEDKLLAFVEAWANKDAPIIEDDLVEGAFSSIDDVVKAVDDNKKVFWKTTDYVVGKDLYGEYYITFRPWSRNPHTIKLFHTDGTTTDYTPEDFIVTEAAKEGALYVLKVAEPGSDKFQPQFSGSKKECTDEWRDTKHSWDKGSKHKIEKHVDNVNESNSELLISTNLFGLEGEIAALKALIAQNTTSASMASGFAESHTGEKPSIMSRVLNAVFDDSTDGKNARAFFLSTDRGFKTLRAKIEELTSKRVAEQEIFEYSIKFAQDFYNSIVDQLATIRQQRSVRSGVNEDNNNFIQSVDKAPDTVNDRMGVTKERSEKVKIPADVKSSITKRIAELKQSIEMYDKKGYNDQSVKVNAIECLEKILENLETGDLEGLKKAQIYFETLMSPITDLFPAKLVTWLASSVPALIKENEEYFNPEVTGKWAEKIKDEIDDVLGGNPVKIGRDPSGSGGVLFVVNNGQMVRSDHGDANNPHVATAENLSKIIEKYYRRFRNAGWRFDQPQNGKFVIGVTKGKENALNG